MNRKIIGVTVGSQLPKPNFKQNDPTKGDYIKNKPDFDGLKSRVDTVSGLVGNTAVSEQINEALGQLNNVYVQSEEPTDAPDGTIWVDTDEEGTNSGGGSSDVFVVHVTMDENWENIETADKTYEEITEAVNSGKACFLVCDGSVYNLKDLYLDYGAIFGDAYSYFIFVNDGTYEYFYEEIGPGYYAIYAIYNDGEVYNDTITGEYDISEIIRSANNHTIELCFDLRDSESLESINSYTVTTNIGTITDGNTGELYHFARAFIKEGYVDVEFHPDEENGAEVIRVEASFKPMA